MLAAQAHHFPLASTQSNPSSPTFPHPESLSLNGSGLSLSMRTSPPVGTNNNNNNNSSSFSPTIDLHSISSGPNGRGYLDLVQAWGDDKVAAWLTQVGAGQHADLFSKNDIRGGVLLDVDQSALKEMGMRSVGDRVRIAVAIKQLRQKCQQARSHLDRSFASPTTSSFNLQSRSELGRSNGLGRGTGRIPPPLDLTQSNTDLPQAYQPQSSARPAATSARSIPPLLPPPRSQPPPPPSGRSPPTQNQPLPRASGSAPIISTTAASPTQAIGNSSGYPDYALPRAGSTSSLTNYRATSTSPSSSDRARPPTGVVPSRPSTSAQGGAFQQRKPGSNVSALGQQRPSTTSSTPSYAHNQPLSSHPYATSGSPTQDGFNVPSYGRAPLGAQATGGPSNLKLSLLPSPAIAPGGALSPVSEAYRTGYSRPTTPAGAVTPTGPQSSSSLDAVLRKAVKFVADDGGSKMIAVADCQSGREVLGRVLRKFGKIGPNEGDDQNDVEGWGAYAPASDGGLRLLSEGELHAICQNVNAPDRARGLAIQRIHLAKQNRKLQRMLGENTPAISNRPGGVSGTSPTSPNLLGVSVPYTNIEPASPSGSSSGGSDRRLSDEPAPMTQQERGKMNRASTISVMSGLGAGEYLDVAQPASRSPSNGAGQSSRKLRNFFGQRPPSELIATHLTEFFPKAENNKLLSKQVRQSMRRSMVRRDSRSSTMTMPMPTGTSWENAPDRYSLSPSAESRFSGSSGGSSGMVLPTTLTTPDDSSLGSVGMAPRAGRMSSGSGRAPTLAPPNEEAEEEDEMGDSRDMTGSLLAKAGRRTSRASYSSRLSVSRKDSDTASIVTIDDVTAELEHRRASMASFVESDDEPERVYIPGLAHHLRPPSIALSRDDDFDEEEEDEEEESTEEESEEEEAEVVLDKPVKSGPKWIKGALIGVGAFGSVFLGMNPLSGSLMAVKQVELPTGNSHNEERKKGMLDALEREIELLKVLRHENIVQYLDSSSDDTHLNIFLEYVPGGSVAALLSNYGAFEEALVSKFVRQILTGLDYLHEREIIHRDIKGANILVDNKGGIKISDFGISKKVEDNLLTGAKVHRPSLQGSVYWMAPEVVKQTAYTSKADIWSLGCLVVEMLTGAHPWANLTQMQAIFRIGSSVRPTVPDDISTEADDFLEQTFEIDHLDRPSARTLLEHGFIREEEAEGEKGGGGGGGGAKEQQTPTRATFSQAGSG